MKFPDSSFPDSHINVKKMVAKFLQRNPLRLAIVIIALINVSLHLVFYNTLGFHRDELLYFSLGRHLSAGYASVPPLSGFIAFLMINTFGSTLFAARLLPSLFSGIIVILAALMAKEMKGGKFAQVLAAIGMVILPLSLRAFYMFQPVFLDIFFWTLIFWLVLRFINTRKDLYLYLTGIATGFAFLNKYLVLLQLFALISVFIFTHNREIFRRRSFWISIGIAFIIALTNLIWQVIHGLPVVTHIQALSDSQLVHVNRVAFLTDQLFMGFMTSFLILSGIVFLLFNNSVKTYRPLLFASLLVILILLTLRGKSYYTAGLFPFLVTVGAVAWEKWIKSKSLRIIGVSILVLLTIPFLPMGIPVWPKENLAKYFDFMKTRIGFDVVLRDEDGLYHALPQDYSDMLGWDELAAAAGKAYNQIPDKSSCFLYCENYGQAGALTVLGKQYELPQPVCFSESFYYWIPKTFPVEIQSVIYINDEMGDDIAEIFSDIWIIGGITDPLAREYGTKVYLCTLPVKSFNHFWMERYPQVKSPF